MVVDAVVLAGGSAKGLSVEETDTKALITIHDRPMVGYVVDALRRTPEVQKIVVVISKDGSREAWAEEADVIVVSDGSMTDNLFAGLEKVDQKGLVLVTSADIPLLSSKAISDFLERCSRFEAKLYYPIIARGELEKQYPGSVRTYARMKEGYYTGGNIALLDYETFLANRDLLEKFYGLRKSPLKLALTIGLASIIKFLFHRLTMAEGERKISNLIKAKGIAIITPYAEIGIDVDKDSDLELVSTVLARNR